MPTADGGYMEVVRNLCVPIKLDIQWRKHAGDRKILKRNALVRLRNFLVLEHTDQFEALLAIRSGRHIARLREILHRELDNRSR